MKLLKTAFRSLIGNGLKTGLNVFVLSISFVLIIFMQALLNGWAKQAVTDAVSWEISGGQYWSANYDPYDIFSLDSSAQKLPESFQSDYLARRVEPILITQATIYPQGRMLGVLLKGIRPEQLLLSLPTHLLVADTTSNEIPVIVGAYMANVANLTENDVFTLRWRDANGTFEAMDVRVAGVFHTTVPSVDNGQLWISLDVLRDMTLMPDAANIIVKSPQIPLKQSDGWEFHDVDDMTRQTIAVVKSKTVGMNIFYSIFLLLALLAIFDTQTLAIFRRQREIGTLVALGMTRQQVVGLFTLEGTLNAVLAIVLGALYGLPLFIYFALYGISFPVDAGDYGLVMADTMYPLFTAKLVVGTILFILVVTAVVSYFPARKIAKMNPTEAIRGKIL